MIESPAFTVHKFPASNDGFTNSSVSPLWYASSIASFAFLFTYNPFSFTKEFIEFLQAACSVLNKVVYALNLKLPEPAREKALSQSLEFLLQSPIISKLQAMPQVSENLTLWLTTHKNIEQELPSFSTKQHERTRRLVSSFYQNLQDSNIKSSSNDETIV